MNPYAIRLAFSYMGVIVGGGFASGQEILQFFTGYGLAGIAGTLLAGGLFAFLGVQLAKMSMQMQVTSHKEVLHCLLGKHAGTAMDLLLTFFLYGVGVAMLASAGSLLRQQYGLDPIVGGLIMAVLVVLTLCLNVKRIIDLISAATPFLMLLVVITVLYGLTTTDAPLDTLMILADKQKTVAPHWALGALLHASFNIAVGFPMLAVIAGRSTHIRTVTLGGMMGGIGLGLLIFLINIGLFSNLNRLQGAELPIVKMANAIPGVGTAMLIAMVCMIYSTAVGMFFAFSARFAQPESSRFKWISLLATAIGLVLSMVGFTKLIGTVYPLLGYLGLILIAAILTRWFVEKRGLKVLKASLSA